MRSSITIALMTFILGVAICSSAFAQQPAETPASQAHSANAIQIRTAEGELEWYEPATDGSGVYEPAKATAPATKSSWGLALFLFGLFGQAMFMGRFALQWIASERSGRSVVPLGFWWLSLAGASILLTYFAIQLEPIGVLGQLLGWPIYLRNIYMVMRDRRMGRVDSTDPAEHPIADPNAEA